MDHMRGTMIFVDIPSFIFHRSYSIVHSRALGDPTALTRLLRGAITMPTLSAQLKTLALLC
jgi:hypothetical protein